MQIINVMLAKNWGGVEQASFDYADALLSRRHHVLPIFRHNSMASKKTKIPALSMRFNAYNLLSIPFLYFKLRSFKPDLIIVHTKHAIFLFRILARLFGIKIVGVAHNPKLKRVTKCDAIFSVTEKQRGNFIASGFLPDHIFCVPNLIRMELPFQKRFFHNPPIFGMMGRFEWMKGFDLFLDALVLLKERSVPFKARIACDKADELKSLIKSHGLESYVEYIGWVTDKKSFFDNIDVFVLPSRNESFGIVLLESALYSTPIISSESDGPVEIFSDKNAVLFFPLDDAKTLSIQMENMISDEARASEHAQTAYNHVMENYSFERVSHILDNAVQSVVNMK